jgi:DoxX-like family
MRKAGWFLTGFIGLFLFVDGAARLAGFAPYVEGTTRFGYAAWMAPWIGITLVVASVLMMLPRTAVLGCILVTGYLGGATATQVRAQAPSFLFPIVLGVLCWLGLYLRDARLRALVRTS